MVVYPYLLNNGFLLYKDLINPYPPFFTLFLSLFTKVFGYQPFRFQLLTWTIILVIDLSIFFVSRAISKNNLAAAIALLFFVIFSIPFGVNGLWFDLVQTPFILLAVYNLIQFLKYKRNHNFFLLAFLITLTFFIKQQAVWLIFWLVLILLIKTDKKIKKLSVSFRALAILLAPAVLIFLISWFYFTRKGIGNDFIFWVFQFPLLKVSQASGYLLLPTVKQMFITLLSLIISMLALISKNVTKKYLVFAALPLILFAFPRFDYFHLIPYLSVVSISAGLVLVNLKILNFSQQSVLLIALLLFISTSTRFYTLNWQGGIRFFEPPIIDAAKSLKNKLQGKLTYIQNGPDQLFPLTNTLPPRPWVDEFPWYMEINGVQQKILASLTKNDLEYIISKPYEYGEKYQLGVYRPEIIAGYLESNYKQVGLLPAGLILKKRIE